MNKEYDINIDWGKEFLDFSCWGVCGSVIDTETGRVRAATLSEVEEAIYRQQIDKYYKHMENKQPTRDSKGRFMKKENKKAFDYEGAYKQQKEVIADLKKESEYYKELAERLGADYLETCAKLGHIKSSLKAYETCWPKLKKLAKHWRKRALRGEDRYLATLDYLRMAVMQIGCLRNMLPWYKKLIYRSELKLMDEEIERILSGAELLDKE